MSESSSPPDPFSAARANLRDTVKWLITIFAALAAAVVGTTPFTGLGSLSIGWRLLVATVAGAFALAVIFRAVYWAFQLLVAKPFFFEDLRTETSLRRFIEDHSIDLLPPEYPTFDDFIYARNAAIDLLRHGRPPIGSPDYDGYLKARTFHEKSSEIIATISRLAHYERIRSGLVESGPRLFLLAALATVALGLFAWTANPGKDRTASPAFYWYPTQPGSAQLGGMNYTQLVGQIAATCGRMPVVTRNASQGSELWQYEFRWTEPEVCRGLVLRTP